MEYEGALMYTEGNTLLVPRRDIVIASIGKPSNAFIIITNGVHGG